GADEFAANRRDEREVRLEAFDAVLQRLDGESGRAAEALRRAYADRRAHIAASETSPSPPNTVAGFPLELRLIDAERDSIALSYEQTRSPDEGGGRIGGGVDLEEARVRHAMAVAGR